MATKSICKDVRIRDKNLGRSLANALENTRALKNKTVEFQRAPKHIEKGDIQKFFGERK